MLPSYRVTCAPCRDRGKRRDNEQWQARGRRLHKPSSRTRWHLLGGKRERAHQNDHSRQRRLTFFAPLTLVATDTGAQPITSEDDKLLLAVNGEIYNHRALRKQLKNPATFKTHSDCEVILHLVRPPPPRCRGGSPSPRC